ncbi:MAG: amidohydrolase [Tissierellia bacterium]|nr:amidohydrolase [Tissierellia bacterium]
MNIKDQAIVYKNYTVDLRREFHSNPEAALNEFETVKRIERELKSIGIPYEIVGETGIVATIEGNKDGKKVALRADIDALELDDLKEVSYKSKNPGLNHACGHDGHTAMLITAGRILYENIDKLNGTVLLIFQPAEESISGAKKMLAEKNFLEDVDSILGIHLMSTLESGKVGYSYGASMSSADSFVIKLQGKGGHGSSPHLSVDPLVAACALVTDAQHIISREISPDEFGVLTFGIVNSGTRHNIIPDSALIEGTIRTYNKNVRDIIKAALERVAKSVSDAYRTEMTIKYPTQTSSVVNVGTHVDFSLNTIKKLVDEDYVVELPRSTGSEDFSYFLEKAPGLYLHIGAGNKEKGIIYPHHHPKFDIDEDALPVGAALYAQYAVDFINEF